MKKRVLSILLACAMCVSLGAFAAAEEQTVLMDNETACVTVTGYDPDGEDGPVLTVQVENRTEGQLNFFMERASVNGRMVGAAWDAHIPAGQTEQTQLLWPADDLARAGIRYIESVQGYLRIWDMDAQADLLAEPVAWTAPAAEQEGAAVEEPVFDHGFEPVEVLTGDVTLTVVDYDPTGGPEGVPSLMLCGENRTDSAVDITVNSVAVNGFTVSLGWYKTVEPGMSAYSPLVLSKDTLEDSRIDPAAVATIGLDAMAMGSYPLVGEPSDEMWAEGPIAEGNVTLTVGEDTGEPAAVEGTVLVDNDTLTVTALDFEQQEWGEGFELYLENKTDRELQLDMMDLSVNGMMCGWWGEQLEPGGKCFSDMIISNEELTRAGVSYVQTVKGTISVWDYDSDSDPLVCQVPVELTAPDGSGEGPAVTEPVFDNGFEPVEVLTGDLAATVVDYDPDGGYEGMPCLTFYVKNDTDAAVDFRAMDVAINGMMVDMGWGQSVSPGMAAYSTMMMDSYYLDEAGIDPATIQSIRFTLEALDEQWQTLASQATELTVAEGGQTESAGMKDFGHGFEPVEVLTGDVVATVVDYDPTGSYDDSPQLTFYLQNNTDRTVYFTTENTMVNGFSCYMYLNDSLPAGTSAYSTGSWDSYDLKQNHVDTIRTVSFTLAAKDDETYEDIVAAPVELTVAEGGEETAEPAGKSTVLMDNETLSITMTGFDPAGENGPCFELLAENKSASDLDLNIGKALVNGRVMRGRSLTLNAGTKKYVNLSWSEKELAMSGVNYIETVKFTLDVAEWSDSYQELYTQDVELTAPTEGMEGPATQEPDYGHGFEPVTLLEADGLTVTAVDFDPDPGEDSYCAAQLMLHAVNDTGSEVYFSVSDETVNGTACDGYWSVALPVGTESYSALEWDSYTLEQAHVEEIYSVGFTVTARDTESYYDLASAPAALTLAEGGDEVSPADGILLVEGSLARLTATYDPEEHSFDILTENLSEMELRFQMENITVNGLFSYRSWSTEVQPGMRSYESLGWSNEEMAVNGINYVDTVTATLKIYSGDGSYLGSNELAWNAPTDGMEGPAWEEPVFDGPEPVEVMTGSMSLTLLGYVPGEKDEWGNQDFSLLAIRAENTTGGQVYLRIGDLMVNGQESYGGISFYLPDGAVSYFPVTLYENDIETVSFNAEAEETYSYSTIASGSATVDVTGIG